MATTGTKVTSGNSDFIGLNEAMKVIFEDPINEVVVSESELLNLFETDPSIPVKESLGGRYIELAHYFDDGGGVGARTESDYMPTPTSPVIKSSDVFLKKNMLVVEMSGQAYRRVKQGEAAFLDWAASALPKGVRRLQHHLDRQAFAFGKGIMAQVSSISSNTITLKNAYGTSVSFSDAATLFQVNDLLRIGPNADGSSLRTDPAAGCKVTDVSVSGGTITVSNVPASSAANDYIFLGDANGDGSWGGGTTDKEMMGLLGIVDDGTNVSTFQNLARSGLTRWQGVIQDSTAAGFSGVLSEDLLTKVDDDIFVQGGGKPDFLVTGRSGLRSYWKSLKGDRMFVDPRSYTGGKENAGMQIILGDRTLTARVARKCPTELAFLIEKASLKRWQVKGYSWDDTTGSIWKQWSDGTGRKDAFYAWGVYEAQLGCVAPRHNAQIQKLAAA